jgi:hypothetical protein
VRKWRRPRSRAPSSPLPSTTPLQASGRRCTPASVATLLCTVASGQWLSLMSVDVRMYMLADCRACSARWSVCCNNMSLCCVCERRSKLSSAVCRATFMIPLSGQCKTSSCPGCARRRPPRSNSATRRALQPWSVTALAAWRQSVKIIARHDVRSLRALPKCRYAAHLFRCSAQAPAAYTHDSCGSSSGMCVLLLHVMPKAD